MFPLSVPPKSTLLNSIHIDALQTTRGGNEAKMAIIYRKMEGWFEQAFKDSLIRYASDLLLIDPNFDLNHVPIKISADRLIANLREMPDSDLLKLRLEACGGGGLFKNQIETLVLVIFAIAINGYRPGTVIAPMQSGKTGIAVAMALFLPPIIYSITGVKLMPIILSTPNLSHHAQMGAEIRYVKNVYGGMWITNEENPTGAFDLGSLLRKSLQKNGEEIPVLGNFHRFSKAPTPLNYYDVFVDPSSQSAFGSRDMHLAKTSGNNIAEMKERLADATRKKMVGFILTDEPQHGASGTMVETGKIDRYGRPVTSGCILKSMFNGAIKGILDDSNGGMFICFSATPFDTAHMDNFWHLKSRLGDHYVGMPYWNGSPFDPLVKTIEPRVLSLKEVSEEIGEEIFKEPKKLFKLFKSGYLGASRAEFIEMRRVLDIFFDYAEDYRSIQAEEIGVDRPELVDTMDDMLSRKFGGCIRITNSNTGSDKLLSKLALDDRFQFIRHYGSHTKIDGRSLSVKEILANPKFYDPNGLPPLFIVTGGARMADSFPAEIEWFCDFSDSASDMNSVLQGLYGRACGNGKFFSRVFLGIRPTEMIRDYIERKGQVAGKLSRHSTNHSTTTGSKKKSLMLRLYRNSPNITPFLAEMMDGIQKFYIDERFPGEYDSLMTRSDSGIRFDLESLLIKLGYSCDYYVNHFNDPDVQKQVWPDDPYSPILNPFNGDSIRITTKKGGTQDFPHDYIPGEGLKMSLRRRGYDAVSTGHFGTTNRDSRHRDIDDDLSDITVIEDGDNRLSDRHSQHIIRGKKCRSEIQLNCTIVDEYGKEIPLGPNGRPWKKGKVICWLHTVPLDKESIGIVVVHHQKPTCRANGWNSIALSEDELNMPKIKDQMK